MASSELSSSEINQGQGFYHDSKNEMPGIPALPTPLAPSQITLEAEEGFWKKYSSHYEFPLSLVIAIGIHVIAILFVVAFMTINFYWGDPKPIVIEQMADEPRINDDNNPTDKPTPGGHTGDDGNNARDPFASQFDPLILTKEADPLNMPKVTDPVDPLHLPTPPSGLVQPDRSGLPGPKGKGMLGKSGDNIGPDNGSGSYMGRNKRWRIHFSYDEPEVLLSQFANLQVTAAVRVNSGRFIVYKNLAATQPFKYEEMTDAAFATFVNDAKQLWFISNDRVTCDNFGYAVNVSERPLTLVIVIPHEMEKAILAAELKYHNMTEDQIREKRLGTSFNVVREGTNWKVTVTKSEVIK